MGRIHWKRRGAAHRTDAQCRIAGGGRRRIDQTGQLSKSSDILPAMKSARTKKAMNAASAHVLEAIPNIGKSLANDLRILGITRPGQLIGQDPHSLFLKLCQKTGSRQDPCVLDTFVSAVRFMEGAPALPWWHYTAERKKVSSTTSPSRRPRTAPGR